MNKRKQQDIARNNKKGLIRSGRAMGRGRGGSRSRGGGRGRGSRSTYNTDSDSDSEDDIVSDSDDDKSAASDEVLSEDMDRDRDDGSNDESEEEKDRGRKKPLKGQYLISERSLAAITNAARALPASSSYRKKPSKRTAASKLRSRNNVIDNWLGDEDGSDAYADLENFLVE